MLFPPSLITSPYGLALFSCPPVNKPSCQTVLFQDFPLLAAAGAKCVPQVGQHCTFLRGITRNISTYFKNCVPLLFVADCRCRKAVVEPLNSLFFWSVFPRKSLCGMWASYVSGILLVDQFELVGECEQHCPPGMNRQRKEHHLCRLTTQVVISIMCSTEPTEQ